MTYAIDLSQPQWHIQTHLTQENQKNQNTNKNQKHQSLNNYIESQGMITEVSNVTYTNTKVIYTITYFLRVTNDFQIQSFLELCIK